MKKAVKYIIISSAILFLGFILASFGLNFWLKNNLPNYIKNNSHYQIGYKTLNVDLLTGNILATQLSVHSKNPNDENVIGLDGGIDSLKISRLGIWDALMNKKINSSNLEMTRPNLKMTLAKPIDDRTGKKRNPIGFKNIIIKNGDIQIFRYTKQRYLSVNQLDLKVSNLQMTEESVENKLPIVFDEYNISGTNFFFRPDNVYILKSSKIQTYNGEMNIQNFQLIPLLTHAQFTKFYPKKRNLFDFKAKTMTFKDIVLKNNKIKLSNVNFNHSDLKIFTTNSKSEKKSKSFKYEVNLDDVRMDNTKVQILKSNSERLFSAENINLNINKLSMNEETAKGNIPFNYEKFLISGKNLNYITDYQNIKVKTIAINPSSVESRGISVKPIISTTEKALLDINLSHAYAIVNNWKLDNNKLKLDIKNIVADGLNGTLTAPENESRKKRSLQQIQFPLKVKNIILKNSNLKIEKQVNELYFNNLHASIQDIEMNAKTVNKDIPVSVGNYSFTTKNFNYKTKFYTFSAGLLKFQKNNFLMNNFAMKPNFSRSQFIKIIPVERDLYTISANQITGNGTWNFASGNTFLNAQNILLNHVNANIFRSKIPKHDPSVKPLYSELLRKISFPVLVKNLDVKNSVLVYEEDTKKSDGPGKLTFSNFNINVKNINSAKKGQATEVPIRIQCQFMESSPMNVKWVFNTADLNDSFQISGNITDLPASHINTFVEPYLKIRTTGHISDLNFSYRGNKNGLNGALRMKHNDLKVSILKESGKKDKLLSAIANLVVKTNSKSFPESVVVDDVPRDPTKSFFNLFWKGTEEGLKKILIGKNMEKQEIKAKNTVQNTKTALEQNKKDLQQIKIETAKKAEKIISKGASVKDSIHTKSQKTKFFIRKIFNKKEKAESL